MPRPSPQLVLSFARPKRKRGGLEPDSYEALVTRLREDARRVAMVFKLPDFDLDADRADARDRFGLCFSDGRIRIRLVNVRTGRMLKYSALIDTVVHELAHLRYMDHGPRWEALYRRMLEWCRIQGIYEPRPVGVAPKPRRAPRTHASRESPQLSLFAPPKPPEKQRPPLVPEPLDTGEHAGLAQRLLDALGGS